MIMPRIVGSFPPININYAPKKLGAGEKNLLKINLEIPEGFDIMAHKPAEEFLIPAEVIFKPLDGVIIGEPSYPEPIKEKLEWSDTILLLYKGRIEVDVPIEVARNGMLELSGVISFQGCTANQCLPPKKQEFTLALEVV